MLVIISAIIFSSCTKNTPDSVEDLSPETHFELFPGQMLGLQGSTLFLNIISSEPDSCMNAVLDANLQIEGNNIVLELDGISYPALCDSGNEYISGQFEIPGDQGTYPIEIKRNAMTRTSGSILITNESVSLDIDDSDGVSIIESTMFLIKENFYWGYFAYRSGTNSIPDFTLEEVASEFYSISRGYEDLPKGNYYHFTVSEDGSIAIPELDEEAIPLAIDLSIQGGWERFKSNLELLSSTRGDLYFNFTNSKGQNHHN